MNEQTRNTLGSICEQIQLPQNNIEALELTGDDPVLPSSFKIGVAAQSAIATAAMAANEIWHQRTGKRQKIKCDMGHAAIEFRSERYQRINGKPPPNLWDKIAGTYQTGDGRWVRLHTNFAHHRDGILDLLDCENNRDAVNEALSNWKGQQFEDAIAECGLVATMMRTREEWNAHPQAKALDKQP
nr:CoA transferase [Alphaproteobacteria bacterium]